MTDTGLPKAALSKPPVIYPELPPHHEAHSGPKHLSPSSHVSPRGFKSSSKEPRSRCATIIRDGEGQNYAACDTDDEGPERKGDSPGGYKADLAPASCFP